MFIICDVVLCQCVSRLQCTVMSAESVSKSKDKKKNKNNSNNVNNNNKNNDNLFCTAHS